jgi:putative colanic acid biosynthesis UDP-glucose lipid carrier transferase
MQAGEHTIKRRTWTRILDALAIWLAGHIAGALCFDGPLSSVDPVHTVLLHFGAALAFAFLFRLYDHFAGPCHADHVVASGAAFSWGILLAGTLVLPVMLHDVGNLSASWVLSWYMLGTFLLFLHRQNVYQVLMSRYQHGISMTSVIIVGFDHTGQQMLEQARVQRYCGYDVKAVYSDERMGQSCNISQCDIISTFEQVARYVVDNNIQEIWVALPLSDCQKVSALRDVLRNEPVNIHWVPDIPASQGLETRVVNLFGFPAFGFDQLAYGPLRIITKEIFDRIFAAAVLTALSPLFLVIAISIKLTSPGPLLFKQARHGRNGKIFYIYKFRSMIADAESKGFVQAVRNDSRITRLGAFIRRTSLDELPQFFNVLCGDMSVVGPRPHPLELNDSVKERLQAYMLRHRVKPGITGWAQIHGCRGETETLDKMAKRLQYDLEYIQNWSLLLDLKIIAWTAFKGWTGKTAY